MDEQKKSPIFVAKIELGYADKMERDLQEKGFTITKPAYTVFSARKERLSVTLYQSGKLTVQGKDSQELIEFYIEPEILGTFGHTSKEAYIDTSPRIGVDESGKGDFFGPLVIAAVYGDESTIPKLIEIGCKDSKALKDAAILQIAKKIRAAVHYDVIRISPGKYNELYAKFGNLNTLLAWGHAQAISNLVQRTGCKRAIIDQFASEHVVKNALMKKEKDIQLTQRHKGEEDVVVAAASILAREGFLLGMMALEKSYDMPFPKGASSKTIAAANDFARRFGKQRLAETAKTHFKTYLEIQDNH